MSIQDKILVVDDDEPFRNLMLAHLEKKGYTTAGARDGFEAVQLLRFNGPYSVMVTDMMMPGMGGLELLRMAKKLDSDIEVIVVTASGSLEAAVSALREDGAFDFLTKPLEIMTELSIAVDRAAGFRELRMERASLRTRQAEEAERFLAVVTAVHEPIITVDRDGILEMANARGRKFLKSYQPGLSIMELLPESLCTLVVNWKTIAKGTRARVVCYLPDIGVRQVLFQPIHASPGWPSGWMLTITDRYDYPLIRKYLGSVQTELDEMSGAKTSMVRVLSELIRSRDLQEAGIRQKIAEAAHYLKKVDQSIHKIQSALELCRKPAEHYTGNILAASPLVDLTKWPAPEKNSCCPGVNWVVPESISCFRGDPDLIWSAVKLFQEINLSESGSMEPAVSVKAGESDGWVWLKLKDLSGKGIQENSDTGITDEDALIVQVVVDRMGGQFWQLLGGQNRQTAFTFPAVSRRETLREIHGW